MADAACYNCGTTEAVAVLPTIDSVVITCRDCVDGLMERLHG